MAVPAVRTILTQSGEETLTGVISVRIHDESVKEAEVLSVKPGHGLIISENKEKELVVSRVLSNQFV